MKRDTCREPCVRPPVSDKIYIAWTPLGVFLLPCFTVGSTHCVSFTLLLLSIIACWDFSHHSQHFSFFYHPLWNAGICEASRRVFSPPKKWFRGTTQSLRWWGSDIATILYADWILVLYLASLDLVYKLKMLHDRRWCYWDAEDNLKRSQYINISNYPFFIT